MRSEIVNGIGDLGFTILHSDTEHHYSVHAKRGQVGVFRVDAANVIDWGWVETPNGRIDVRCWMDFYTALETVPR